MVPPNETPEVKIANQALKWLRNGARPLVNRMLNRYQIGSGQVGLENVRNREQWLECVLAEIPAGSRILDAGAGEQQYKRFCRHLQYVSQDFAQYDGKGDSG